LTLPWLAAKEMTAAASSWAADPEAAYDRLERARALNPLSDRPDQLMGAIASRRGDWTTMRSAFERSLERNPASWYAHFELAVVAAVEGRRQEALSELAEAERLNPSEPAIAELRPKIERGEPVDPDALDRFFFERLEDRTR
jgi:tetratricopeptide (TPR) repeat protein